MDLEDDIIVESFTFSADFVVVDQSLIDYFIPSKMQFSKETLEKFK